MGQTIFRVLAILIFLFLILLIWLKQGQWEIQNAFLVYTLTAVIGGFLFVTLVLPKLGEAVSTAVLSSGEEVEKDPYQKAHSKVAMGDYQGAVDEFQRISHEEPNNRRPVAEITKLYLDKLHNVDGAIRTLEQAMNRPGWQDDDMAFFLFRLVDLNLEFRNDTDRAVTLLQDVMQRFPDTRHAANAVHRLREIDPALLSAIFDSESGAEAPSAGPAAGPAVPRPDIVRRPDAAPSPDAVRPPRPDQV